MRFRREQYLELLTFGRVDRQIFVELFGPLVGLEDEWRSQGARKEEVSLEAFDWDDVPTIDCGLTAIYPIEPAAGMDCVELRKRDGRK